MKKQVIKGMLAASAAALMLGVSAAHANVIDELVGSAKLGNSGDGTELAFIRSITGDNTLTLDFKINDNDSSFNVMSNGLDSWFIDVAPDTPGYFMLKLGVPGNSTLHSHYVFKNIGELDKLVWSNDQVNYLTGGNCGLNGSPNSCNIGRLSHYVGTQGIGGEDPEVPGEIPEPASMLLFGAGLLGLGLSRRRKLV
ncbi:VPLPA-CTERM protein sorting domain-containing protein [Nitrosomonas europaea]|uniref:Ice-binding protein C-terminal domain-containing protein n=2 Tax=Nitrosomonas europaea TaxID=915 RepID=Q82UB9_NITEU|nr:PEP-CTERM sorting domain-containing protein [Nitrosomonas sp.]CAD85486.1 hypothetical protein NE1575 [Nitrosomonas europaea ATCC 19718]SDW82744.1 VPLPA-CTERM protein sorting domain-containing protein [Nitrosomonas europaea]SET36753.1 VPLPA-CTERM protein sorting domain-containing protein [Nitrosomonas europaea]SJZ91742.1 VPLPA-CTERM protein sorting domain-containing protein [Nitrosomonas europaea]HBF25213.1 PEP-CTERM sorting domain-containing protein [Nitrosomonas sp.]